MLADLIYSQERINQKDPSACVVTQPINPS